MITTPHTHRRLSVTDALAAIVILLFSVYVYIGFFHPDPYILEGSIHRVRATSILLMIRLGFPILVICILLLFLGFRTGRLAGSSIILMSGSLAVTLCVGYVVLDLLYQNSLQRNADQYHPYFQLKPRTYEPSLLPRDQKFVIMCLGGSTTEFADPSGKDWPSRLHDRLQQRGFGKNIEVSNMGRQWYTTQHILLNYELNLRHYKPDVIIVMEAVNDLLHNADFSYFSHSSFRQDYGHFYGPVNRIIGRQGLMATLTDLFGGLWYAKPREIIDTDSFPGLAAYRRNLETLIQLAKHDSTQVILMTQASLFKEPCTAEERAALYLLNQEAIGPTRQWSLRSAIRGMDAYNTLLRQIAAEHQLALIDLERHIPKSLEYLYDEVHYQQKTYDIVASFIEQGIVTAGILH